MHWRLIITTASLALSIGLVMPSTPWAGEHPGEEHGGKAVGDEHAGKEAKTYNAAQIKKAMNTYINADIKKNNGTFVIIDKDKNNQKLELKFIKIHDPVRKIEGKGYFACTDFSLVGNPEKIYDLDFWLNPKDGGLVVTDVKVHKDPVQENGKWVKKARYTFVKDKPVEIK